MLYSCGDSTIVVNAATEVAYSCLQHASKAKLRRFKLADEVVKRIDILIADSPVVINYLFPVLNKVQ